MKKIKAAWQRNKPVVKVVAISAGLFAAAILVSDNQEKKTKIESLRNKERAQFDEILYLNKELGLAEESAWDYHDLAYDLAQKVSKTDPDAIKLLESKYNGYKSPRLVP